MENNEIIEKITLAEIAIRMAVLTYPKTATLDYERVWDELKKENPVVKCSDVEKVMKLMVKEGTLKREFYKHRISPNVDQKKLLKGLKGLQEAIQE